MDEEPIYDPDAPEPGARVKVETDDGEETAIYTGHGYFAEDGSRAIENVKSWQEQPLDEELKISGLPDQLEEPPVGDADEAGGAGEEEAGGE